MSLRTTTTTIVVGIVTLLLLCSAKSTLGFTLPQPSSTRTHHRDGQLKLSVVDLQQPLQDAVTHYQYHHGANMDVLHSTTTSTLVSAAADAAAEKGWWGTAWGAYVNVFRNTLDGVHNTIDGPLRAVGIEQTWGPSIAIFTMMVRSLLVPLSIQQSKSAEYMKALKPYVSEIKKKYKDNENAMNRAIGQLYSDAEQNPLAGCLVSFAQIPVFLGLYRGVRVLAMEDRLGEGFLWIPSLEGPVSPPTFRGLEWLTDGWVDGAPSMGWETTLAFLIMPVILVVLQSITMQVLQPPVDEDASEEDKAQMEKTQTALKFLPLLIGFFSLQVPAGLTIYWFTSNIFTLTQSLAVRAYFAANPPDIELPEYWDRALAGDLENMSAEERRQASEAGIRVGPTMDDLVLQAKFHSYIERRPVISTSVQGDIPPEMKDWVGPRAPKEAPAETQTV